ncbi:MAG: type II toxin-antitoxin system death-on-curing family toxin [Ferruginibacter sp.]|nr:type II toxin-antitoxin system death-on-curing family toxin [Ferruginibacter sp.]
MILINDILKLHEASIDDFGGAKGVRDLGHLESAIARPFQTFGGENLYKTAYEMAAALGESLIINHPFMDGNKRTGLLGILSLLFENNLLLKATEEETYDLTIKISTGEIKFEEIVIWLKNNTTAT